MERADEPRANPTYPRGAPEGAEDGCLASDVLVLMAAAGVRLREVTAREEPPEGVRTPPSEADPSPAPAPLALIARARDGVLVAPGWGRRAPPPLR